MRRTVASAVTIAVCLAAAAPVHAAGRRTEIVQFARQVDAPGAAHARSALGRRLQALGLGVRAFRKLPMLVLSGSRAQISRAVRAPGVIYHHRGGRRIVFDLDRSVPLIFERQQERSWSMGADGRGVTVAIVDTGADATHPDLMNQVTHNVEFAFDSAEFGSGTVPSGTLPPVAVTQECPAVCNTDAYGHGTHVAGIIAGDGTISMGQVRGVAPGAKVVALSISDSGLAVEFYALAGFDYLLAHPELDVSAVNNSWHIPGERFDPTDPINQATKMLHDHGMAVVFAAGNDGSNGSPRSGAPEGSSDCESGGSSCRVTLQSVAPWTISVAAGARVTDGTPSEQHLADFSSRGDPKPVDEKGMSILYEPTLTAPGTAIVSAADNVSEIGNGVACAGFGDTQRCLDRSPTEIPFYTALSGTSMASPHVVGAIAVLQSAARAKLGRRLTPDEVKQLLVAGAQQMTGLDGKYDGCGTSIPMQDGPCGGKTDGTTGKPYEPWQVGAGYLDLIGSLRGLDVLANPPAPAPVVVAPAPKSQPKKVVKHHARARKCATKHRKRAHHARAKRCRAKRRH